MNYITPKKFKFDQPKKMSDFEKGIWLGFFIGIASLFIWIIILFFLI